jgi:sigma-B regulation protein RsbU (phosphoserine phosphatase)
MPRPNIQVVLAEQAVPDALRAALDHCDAITSFWPLDQALRHDALRSADAVVLVAPATLGELTRPLRIFFDHLTAQPRPVLLLAAGQAPLPFDVPAGVPLAPANRNDPRDIAARLETLLALRPAFVSLQRGLAANRRNGENLTRRYVSQLRLASQVQRQFLPETLPSYGPITFNVLFRPLDYVSGDIYDVHRLDEDHVGIAVADASGHGIPAALLTVYIKRALRGKEIEHGTYRLLEPDEVLSRLNEDLVDAQLAECPFVAAAYAVLNVRTLELALARGGVPFPLLRTADGDVQVLDSPGGVLGIVPGARFETRRVQLAPGDNLLLYSDGIERVLTDQPVYATRSVARRPHRDDQAAAHAAQMLGDDAETATAVATLPAVTAPSMPAPWTDALEVHGVESALRQIERRHRALRRMGHPLDDLTILAVRVAP